LGPEYLDEENDEGHDEAEDEPQVDELEVGRLRDGVIHALGQML
jgi:hypothetical protein